MPKVKVNSLKVIIMYLVWMSVSVTIFILLLLLLLAFQPARPAKPNSITSKPGLKLSSVQEALSPAQDIFKWPADTAAARTQWVLLSDAVKEHRFQDGLTSYVYLAEKAPELHVSLYIYGEKVYKGLIDSEPDMAKKEAFTDSLLALYDRRMTYFEGVANVINRKLLAAYQYFKNKQHKLDELYGLFESAFQNHGASFTQSNLIAYMDVIRISQKNSAVLNDEAVLNRYDRVSQLLSLAAYSESEVEKQQDILDKLLVASVTLNCNLIEEKFNTPFLEQYQDNLSRAKKVIALALAYDCKDTDGFLEAAALVFEHEPTYGLARMLALHYDKREVYKKAENYYSEAVNCATEKDKKAEMLLNMAEHYQRRELKHAARKAAMKAVEVDTNFKAAYKLIGDLYFSSFYSCKEGESAVLDRAVYIAAYQMYKKAGRPDLMKQARIQFPTIEQIFQEGYKEGQIISLACWLNERVILQASDQVQ
ncbi:tetratricopeptide (TPR) repeat protein [Catalinimonas alkaloidigena]|uniref:hypothetical protein n=1 Tax=Catalinimonas alkaloidigena TaxID=1075417 RepID=UPI002406D4F5|nr:hypothetical protein [Catalinimonas alkaloidigena]MDF9796650.1 tetratricopeptide (TPR) repeat protein [Catalinimonas alkaloidigena]